MKNWNLKFCHPNLHGIATKTYFRMLYNVLLLLEKIEREWIVYACRENTDCAMNVSDVCFIYIHHVTIIWLNWATICGKATNISTQNWFQIIIVKCKKALKHEVSTLTHKKINQPWIYEQNKQTEKWNIIKLFKQVLLHKTQEKPNWQ